MENSSNRIAVVIAAKNAARYIGECLESLVSQKDSPDEVILYDDASTDDTLLIANGFSDRIRNFTILAGEKSVGISAARNAGNGKVTADWIAVLDADDVFPPDAIHKYRNAVSTSESIDLVYGDTQVFRRNRKDAKLNSYPEMKSSQAGIRRILGSPVLPFKHSSVLYRTETIRELGGYDEELKIKVDVDLFLRFLAEKKPILKLNEVTSLHRKHSRQISTKRVRGIRIYSSLIRRFESNYAVRVFLFLSRVGAELGKGLVRG